MAAEDKSTACVAVEPDTGDGTAVETETSICRPVSRRHPCSDCRFCQWCSDDRCRLCRGEGNHCGGRKLSVQEQIELYEKVNSKDNGKIQPD